MGPEATLWSWMRKAVPLLGMPHDVHRIETSTESGYPDVEGCIAGTSFLVELKVARSIRKRDGAFSLDHFEAKQAYTLHRRWKAGGRSWILVRYPMATGRDKHFLVPGKEALIVHDDRLRLTLGFMQAVSWPGLEDGLASAGDLWRAVIGPIIRPVEGPSH